MKFRVRKTGRDSYLIIGKGAKSEYIDYNNARYLSPEGSGVFLPFTYSAERSLEFRYIANGMVPLSDFILSPLQSTAFYDILEAFLQLLEACDDDGLSIERTYFDLSMIFYNPAMRRTGFIYLPIIACPAPAGTIGEAIATLCEHARFTSMMDENVAMTIADAVSRAREITTESYGELLRAQGLFGTVSDETSVHGLKADDVAAVDLSGYGSAETELLGLEAGDKPLQGAPYSLTDDTGHYWPLPTGKTVIGRERGCDIIISNAAISRRHAEITWGSDGLRIRDLNSTNGVSVNRLRLAAGADCVIDLHDVVSLGSVTFKVVRSPR